MERVVVVGPPGSGKTTVGKAIAQRLGLQHRELDSLWWDPNWTEAGVEKFGARLRTIVSEPQWVLDGNYFSVGAQTIIWPAADTIVWLDLARWVTVPRVVRRTVVRAIRREELWGTGNRERIWMALRLDWIVWVSWREHPKYNRRYSDLMDSGATDAMTHVQWIRLRSPRAVREWLGGLR